MGVPFCYHFRIVAKNSNAIGLLSSPDLCFKFFLCYFFMYGDYPIFDINRSIAETRDLKKTFPMEERERNRGYCEVINAIYVK